ncbi:hypothetical protein D9757_006758 [Collybiopsis confluens]|uniref:Protein ZIP4 homolog n=1 Tax=Collybiopsis confluens TaxID=2823264 RepID=A0A8H5M9E8_9AGAR|nr:hypothetical protein D9757_006758 [Collybiopsis confluens]
MSTRKKKIIPSLQEAFKSIQDLLTTTKIQLNETDSSIRPSLIEKLHRISACAESFTERRSRPGNPDCVELCDTLDQEGVNLWNISGLVRKLPDDDGRPLVGGLRLAAFRLVEAGLEEKPGLQTLIHILGLASKTGATLSELAQNDIAASVLTSAAKYEEMLRTQEDPDGTHRQARTWARAVYFCSRMEAAWKEGNSTVAEFMSQKIMSIYEEQRLALPARDRLVLAAKLNTIGKSILKDQAKESQGKASEAIAWLQKAFGIVDQDDSCGSEVLELKISVLRNLARAYFLSEAYDNAETTLDELIPSLDASKDHASSEHQELRWLRLAILKKRKAGESAILDAFRSIINHMNFSDRTVTDILQDLRTFGHEHTFVNSVNQYLLQQALERGNTGSECIERILLSIIIHCSRDEVHSRAIDIIQGAFTSVCEADVELGGVPAAACLSLLWQYGDRHYYAKRWTEAADWFGAGTHRLFRVNDSFSASKCYRKAALCYLEQREYSRATAMIRCCPSNEAATHYVAFLIATHQGLDDEAIKTMYQMVNAPDFDRKMLLLAIKMSHESEMKNVLLAVLEALLKTLKISDGGETVAEALALLRCIIRLVLKLLLEPTATKSSLIDSVVSHFRTARTLVTTASEQKTTSLIIKDISWLWRTAYNCAVRGCSDWDGFQEQISSLFDVAKDLLETYCQASPVDADPDLYSRLVNSYFCGVTGRVYAAREAMAANGRVVVGELREISEEIRTSKTRITEIIESTISNDNDLQRFQYFLHMLRVFDAELMTQLKDWDRLSVLVSEAVASGPLAVTTYEAIADILWSEKECPIDGQSSSGTNLNQSNSKHFFKVLCGGLEAVLHATLDHNSLSVEKFSRWLRAICTIILARNTSGDRLKAIGYVEQAVNVMEQSNDSDKAYPVDERFWLLATSYNTGFECLEASSLDEAKRWFESATVICRFVPGGKERAEKISETYAQLLARYAPT